MNKIALYLACFSMFSTVSAAEAQRAPTLRRRDDMRGNIVFVSNSLMTCPSGSVGCIQAQTIGGTQQNNDYAMVRIDADADSATFDSSSGNLSIAGTASVSWAGLYWNAKHGGGDGLPDEAARNVVKLRVPGAAGYASVTASVFDGASSSYWGFADVTSMVRAAGNGTYWVADVQTTSGAENSEAGWALVIVYADPTEPLRDLTVFDMSENYSNEGIDVVLNGFLTPTSGPVVTRVGFIASDGDAHEDDHISIIQGSTETLLGTSGALSINPQSDVANSTITYLGSNTATRTPNYINTLGWDADIMETTDAIANGTTSATLRLQTEEEGVLTGVITFATVIHAPNLDIAKTATDINGGRLDAGDEIRYSFVVRNVGDDDATNVMLTDTIPANTAYVSGSLVVNGAARTDATGDDVGSFTDGNLITAFLGEGATSSGGGTLASSGAGSFTTLSFRVRVNDGVADGVAIRNSASARYNGASLGSGSTYVSASDGNPATLAPDSTDISVGEISPDSGLVATKSSSLVEDLNVNGSAEPGDSLQYIVTVTNSSSSARNGVVFYDDVDSSKLQVVSVDTTRGVVESGTSNFVSVALGTLPPAGTATITIVARLNRPWTAGATDVRNQGLFALSGFATVLTDDPAAGGATDATVVAVNGTSCACFVEGVCYADGTVNGSDVCLVCAPVTSVSSWSTLVSCLDAGVADAGTDGGSLPSDMGTTPIDGRVDATIANPRGGLTGGAGCNVVMGNGARGQPWVLALFGIVLLLVLRKSKSGTAGMLVLAIAIAVAAFEWPTNARAQTFALDQYHPGETNADGFAISRPDDLGHLRFDMQLQLDYARNPLVYEGTLGNSSTERAAVVSDQLVGHVRLAFGLANRLTLFAGLPVSILMEGQGVGGAPGPDGTSVGDFDAGARLRLVGEGDDVFALGLQVGVSLPLAHAAMSSSHYAGDRTAVLTPRLMAELRFGALRITGNVGARVRGAAELQNLRIGNELTYGLGVTLALIEKHLDAHAEVFGATAFNNFVDRSETPLESLFGLKWHGTAWTLGAAAGPGLTRGYGSPDFRAILSLGYTTPVEAAARVEPSEPAPEPLQDYVPECPAPERVTAEMAATSGCATSDRDRDGVLDASDGAPDEPEDHDGFQDTDGVPDPDNDQDGVPDANDHCPAELEDRDGIADSDGCPETDADADTILDPQDHCPTQSGPANTRNPECNGCPGRACMQEDGSIQILDRVEFDTGRDTILDSSTHILVDVHDVLAANPQLRMIRVEGHTDDRGDDAANLDLSRRRAQSVMRWLVDHGIDAGRLSAEGFGETRPLQSNRTTRGRQANRRVEFHPVTP